VDSIAAPAAMVTVPSAAAASPHLLPHSVSKTVQTGQHNSKVSS